MSRHRNQKYYDEDEYDVDDVPMTPETPVHMPMTPTSAQYMYQRRGSEDFGAPTSSSVYVPSPGRKPRPVPDEELMFDLDAPADLAVNKVVYPPMMNLGMPALPSLSTKTVIRSESHDLESEEIVEKLRRAKVQEKEAEDAYAAALNNNIADDDFDRSNPSSTAKSPSPPRHSGSPPPSNVGFKSPGLYVPEKQRLKKSKLLEESRSTKPNLNLVVIGHVDAGKSTLMGHMLYLMGRVEEKVVHKYKQDCKDMGKQSFHFAWVLDQHEEERTRGITVDVSINHFDTKSKRITLLDAPGHRDFVENMIAGTAQADAAVLVVAASANEFESGFTDDGQTKEHADLARGLGVRQLIVAVNKMDSVDWDAKRFFQIKAQLFTFLTKKLGFKDIVFVPVSGLTGVNLTKAVSDKKLSSWYTECTLEEAIDNLANPKRESEKALRMTVTDVFKNGAVWSVAAKIITGSVIADDVLLAMPIKQRVAVKSIQNSSSNEQMEIAKAGDNIELALKGVEDPTQLAAGVVLCQPSDPIPVVSRFRCKLETKAVLTLPILKGTPIMVHSLTSSEPGCFGRLFNTLDRKTGDVLTKFPRCLGPRTIANVEIKLSRPLSLCLEKYDDDKDFGRVTLRVEGVTVAAGLVTKLYFDS